MRWLLIPLVATALAACTAAGSGCPCGQSYDSDPNDPGATFYISADHDESAHCLCSCGDDPVERLPPSASCDGYEGACETRAGTTARYTCE